MTDGPTLQAALGDVRRAFRLLWCYQDRLFDIIRAIAGEFESLKFYCWQPNSAKRIDAGTSPLNKSPWYAFPQMNVSYLYRSFEDPNLAKPGDWLLDIRVISDNGFDDLADSPLKADPADFPGIEATESRLNLYAFYCTAEFKGNWLKDIWDKIDWPDPDGKASRDADLPITGVGVSLDIVELPDKEAVQAAVREFKKTASAALGVAID